MDYRAMGEQIRKCRKALRLSQREIAEQIDISVSFLGHIERGTRKASLETIVKIANVFQISTDVLLIDSLTKPIYAADFSNEEREFAAQTIELLRSYKNT